MRSKKSHPTKDALPPAPDSLPQSSESPKSSNFGQQLVSRVCDALSVARRSVRDDLERAKDNHRQFVWRYGELAYEAEATLELAGPLIWAPHSGPSPPGRSPPGANPWLARASPTSGAIEWNGAVKMFEVFRALFIEKELRNEQDMRDTLSEILSFHARIGKRKLSLKKNRLAFCLPRFAHYGSKGDQHSVQVELLHSFCSPAQNSCHADQINITRVEGVHDRPAKPDLSLTVVWSSHHEEKGDPIDGPSPRSDGFSR